MGTVGSEAASKACFIFSFFVVDEPLGRCSPRFSGASLRDLRVDHITCCRRSKREGISAPFTETDDVICPPCVNACVVHDIRGGIGLYQRDLSK